MAQRTGKNRGAYLRVSISAMLLLLVMQACGGSARRAPARPEVASATSAATNGPATIESLRAVEKGPGIDIDVVADRALVWTTYRDAQGNLVVELPNSVPGPGMVNLSRTTGLISSVDVERLDDADRPLTRLVIQTRQPTEHALTSQGDVLHLAVVPAGSDIPVAVARAEPPARRAGSETMAEPPMVKTQAASAGEAPEPAAPLPAAQAASHGADASVVTFASGDYGTPEAPRLGPPIEGVAASRLTEVSVVETGGETVIRVEGDGEFAFATFRLQNPDRFVLDLDGVVNTSLRTTVPVDSKNVDQVRIGQFKPRPEPVSRVVFDLQAFVPPRIERSADGLMIVFGAGTPMVEDTVMADLGAPPGAGVPAEEIAAEEMATPPASATVSTPSAAAPPTVTVAEAPAEMERVDVPAQVAMPESFEDDAPTVMAQAPSQVTVETTPPAAPPIPVFRPEDQPAMADVSRFEAQQVQVTSPQGSAEADNPIPPSFQSLVVSSQQKTYVGDPITMGLRDADLVETLRTFSKISDLNFVIQPGVQGSVTVELNSVPWDQALEQILKINNLGMDIDGTIVRIAPLSQLRAEAQERRRLDELRQQSVPLTTIVRRLSYADVGEVRTMLQGEGSRGGQRAGGSRSSVLSRRGTVQIDERTNTLIIRELPEIMNTVLAVIDLLDTAQPQVRIEARVVEATKTFSRSLGVQWSFNGEASNRLGNTTGLEFPNNVTADGGVNLLTGGNNGFLNLSLGNVLDSFSLDAQLLAAENEGLVNVVTAPSVMTLSNREASIQSGIQLPTQTVANNTVTTQFVNATLQLSVTPHVTAEGTIQMDIRVQKREPQTALLIPGATNAPIATREASTAVIVRDGGTAVIGGIYEVSNNKNQGRVPGLANVPILKHLFRNRSNDHRNEELLIFVTPRIIQM